MFTSTFQLSAIFALAAALAVSALPHHHQPISWSADTCHCPANREADGTLTPAYQAAEDVQGAFSCYYSDYSGKETNVCTFDVNNSYTLSSAEGDLCPDQGLPICPPAAPAPAPPAPTSS